MKHNVFISIFAILFATYFFVVGMGYNVVQYCCSLCESVGIEQVTSDTCDAIHYAHEEEGCCSHDTVPPHQHDDMACSDNTNSDCCLLVRVQTDVASTVSSFQLKTEDLIVNVDFACAILCTFFDHHVQVEQNSLTQPPQPPLDLSGRDILTYHAVLRI